MMHVRVSSTARLRVTLEDAVPLYCDPMYSISVRGDWSERTEERYFGHLCRLSEQPGSSGVSTVLPMKPSVGRASFPGRKSAGVPACPGDACLACGWISTPLSGDPL